VETAGRIAGRTCSIERNGMDISRSFKMVTSSFSSLKFVSTSSACFFIVMHHVLLNKRSPKCSAFHLNSMETAHSIRFRVDQRSALCELAKDQKNVEVVRLHAGDVVHREHETAAAGARGLLYCGCDSRRAWVEEINRSSSGLESW